MNTDLTADKTIPQVGKLYEDMQKQAFDMFPNLKHQIEVINASNVGIRDYQQYMKIINQAPSVITSNQVG